MKTKIKIIVLSLLAIGGLLYLYTFGLFLTQRPPAELLFEIESRDSKGQKWYEGYITEIRYPKSLIYQYLLCCRGSNKDNKPILSNQDGAVLVLHVVGSSLHIDQKKALINAFIGRGLNIDETFTKSRETALLRAIFMAIYDFESEGYVEMVRFLVQKGAKLSFSIPDNKGRLTFEDFTESFYQARRKSVMTSGELDKLIQKRNNVMEILANGNKIK